MRLARIRSLFAAFAVAAALGGALVLPGLVAEEPTAVAKICWGTRC